MSSCRLDMRKVVVFRSQIPIFNIKNVHNILDLRKFEFIRFLYLLAFLNKMNQNIFTTSINFRNRTLYSASECRDLPVLFLFLG